MAFRFVNSSSHAASQSACYQYALSRHQLLDHPARLGEQCNNTFPVPRNLRASSTSQHAQFTTGSSAFFSVLGGAAPYARSLRRNVCGATDTLARTFHPAGSSARERPYRRSLFSGGGKPVLRPAFRHRWVPTVFLVCFCDTSL